MIGDKRTSEVFDTGLRKIHYEIKSQLASHGLYGTVSEIAADLDSSPAAGVKIEVAAKGRVASRCFERGQIEGCYLRVGGDVLRGIGSLVDELAA